jgi:hypothetical protein
MSSFSKNIPVFRIWVCLLHVQIVSRRHNMRMFYGMECNITAFIFACMILSSLRKPKDEIQVKRLCIFSLCCLKVHGLVACGISR